MLTLSLKAITTQIGVHYLQLLFQYTNIGYKDNFQRQHRI
ncbi:hypothetical protein pb186bvf_019792 [Paramecium bursaria]